MRTLWTGLVDDAAVFPPGNAPLPVALGKHRAHRAGPYADVVGPLLVPAAAVTDLVALGGDDEPVRVGVIGRPGTPSGAVRDAVGAAAGTGVRVVSVELGWTGDWPASGLPPDLPLTLEIPRGPDHDLALADVRRAIADGSRVQAKFRTGANPTWRWPDEGELAGWLHAAVRAGIPVKLTGGLHHVVRADHAGGTDPQHGLLNILAATHAAASGSGVAHLRDLLAIRECHDLAALVAVWDAEEVSLVRRSLTAYGCCEVTDPIGELTTIGLLEGPP